MVKYRGLWAVGSFACSGSNAPKEFVTSCLFNLYVGRRDQQREPSFTCSSNSGKGIKETRVILSNHFPNALQHSQVFWYLRNRLSGNNFSYDNLLFKNHPPSSSFRTAHHLHLQFLCLHLQLQLLHLVDHFLSPCIALFQSHQGLQQLPVSLPVKTLGNDHLRLKMRCRIVQATYDCKK